jgi:hypothetical protein
MRTHEERLFRVPIEELRTLLRTQHGVNLSGVEPYIAGDYIVFAVQVSGDKSSPSDQRSGAEATMVRPPRGSGIRRTRRKRNRIKTRGWNVVGKIKNSQGLVANIYEPFVTALRGVRLSRSEQRRLVRQIMIRNSNRPAEASVDYFLDNTLEFISQQEGVSRGRPASGSPQTEAGGQ